MKYGLNSYGSRQATGDGLCKRGNIASGSAKGRVFIDGLIVYYFPKKECSP